MCVCVVVPWVFANKWQKESLGPVKGNKRWSQVKLLYGCTQAHHSNIFPASPSVRCPLWRLFFPAGTAGGQGLRKCIFLNTLPFILPQASLLFFPPDGFTLFLDDRLESTLRKQPHGDTAVYVPLYLHPVRCSSTLSTKDSQLRIRLSIAWLLTGFHLNSLLKELVTGLWCPSQYLQVDCSFCHYADIMYLCKKC